MKRKFSEMSKNWYVDEKGYKHSGVVIPVGIQKPKKKAKLSKVLKKNYLSLGEEIKYHEISFGQSITTTGVILGSPTSLNLIPQGDSDINRHGNKLTITQINLRGTVNTIADTLPAYVRMALILDKQANGAYPSYSDIYKTNTSVHSYLNLNNKDRFTVLKEWTFTLNAPLMFDGADAYYGITKKKISYSKSCNIEIAFGSSGNAITDMRSNNLLVSAICDSADGVRIDMLNRVRFVG